MQFLKNISLLLHSIRFRLALWFVFILAVLLIGFSGLLFYMQVHELRAEALTRLQTRIEKIENFLGLERDGFLSIGTQDPFGGVSDDETPLVRGDVLIFYTSDGIVQKMWGPFPRPPGIDLTNTEITEHEALTEYVTLISEGRRISYVFRIVPLYSADVLTGFMALGTPLDPRDELGKLFLALLALIGFTLVFALAGGFWLADRAMRPVKAITAKARSIGETDLSQRLNLPQKDEIGQLAGAFDSMLARLESAFARQRQFTADASHELRTPLTIVNLETTRALSASRPAKEYQRALQVIQSENELMSHLVNDLLTLARLDERREALHKEPLDLSDLALDVIERLEPLAVRQHIQLVAGELPEVVIHGDRQSLMQMLTNLVENAIKYTAQNEPDKKRQVTVETGTHPTRTLGWVRVTDSGPGIPSEHLAHLFDRFYRADKSRARSDDESTPAGSGLGLAIVDGIAQLHDGKIEVRSKLGEGSTFEIVFPLSTFAPPPTHST